MTHLFLCLYSTKKRNKALKILLKEEAIDYIENVISILEDTFRRLLYFYVCFLAIIGHKLKDTDWALSYVQVLHQIPFKITRPKQ